MKSGVKPKPMKVHEREGTVRPRHRRKKEPEARGALGAAPARLTTDQAAIWKYAIDNAPIDVLKNIDKDVLAVWCQAVDEHRKSTAALAEMNDRDPEHPFLIISGKTGGYVMNPLVRVVHQAALIILRTSEHLGFSPVSRPRLAKEMGDDGLDVPRANNRKSDGEIFDDENVQSFSSFVKNRPK